MADRDAIFQAFDSELDRMPPGRQCAESDNDVGALAVFMVSMQEAQAMDRHSVRDRAGEQFDTDQIVDSVISYLDASRLGARIEGAGSI